MNFGRPLDAARIFLVDLFLLPLLDPQGFAPCEVTAHRKGRIRQVDGILAGDFVFFGHGAVLLSDYLVITGLRVDGFATGFDIELDIELDNGPDNGLDKKIRASRAS